MTGWHWHPSVLIGLAAVLALYLRTGGRMASRRQVVTFLAGTAVLAAAVLGPLAEWAEHVSVSAHMAQHLLLTLVVPPLWLAGTPDGLMLRVGRVPGAARTGRVLTRPAVALALATAVLIAWHRPVFFEMALRRESAHALEHLSLLGTALAAWWPVVGPRFAPWPRPAPPAQLLYLFLSTIPMMVVAAPITLAEELLYPFYARPASPWLLDPRADQELAGVLMWLVGPFAYLIAGTIVFFRWASLEEADAGPGAGGRSALAREHGGRT